MVLIPLFDKHLDYLICVKYQIESRQIGVDEVILVKVASKLPWPGSMPQYALQNMQQAKVKIYQC